eukprot:7013699-Prorocentrum_lima.AAC.1
MFKRLPLPYTQPIVPPQHCPDLPCVPPSLAAAPGSAECVALHGAEELLQRRHARTWAPCPLPHPRARLVPCTPHIQWTSRART